MTASVKEICPKFRYCVACLIPRNSHIILIRDMRQKTILQIQDGSLCMKLCSDRNFLSHFRSYLKDISFVFCFLLFFSFNIKRRAQFGKLPEVVS